MKLFCQFFFIQWVASTYWGKLIDGLITISSLWYLSFSVSQSHSLTLSLSLAPLLVLFPLCDKKIHTLLSGAHIARYNGRMRVLFKAHASLSHARCQSKTRTLVFDLAHASLWSCARVNGISSPEARVTTETELHQVFGLNEENSLWSYCLSLNAFMLIFCSEQRILLYHLFPIFILHFIYLLISTLNNAIPAFHLHNPTAYFHSHFHSHSALHLFISTLILLFISSFYSHLQSLFSPKSLLIPYSSSYFLLLLPAVFIDWKLPRLWAQLNMKVNSLVTSFGF